MKGGIQAMTEEAKAARRQYYREYYQQHKEQRQAANKRYWEKKAVSQRLKPPKSAETESRTA